MKSRFLIILLALLLLLTVTSSISLAAPSANQSAQGSSALTVSAISVAGPWEAQSPAAFKVFSQLGRGTEVIANAVGNQSINIYIPNPYFMDNFFWSISAIEFCAKSSAPTRTKPIKMNIWSYGDLVAMKNINWVNNTGKQCFSRDFNPALFYRDITLSVLITFGNTTDKITLYRAEIVAKHD